MAEGRAVRQIAIFQGHPRSLDRGAAWTGGLLQGLVLAVLATALLVLPPLWRQNCQRGLLRAWSQSITVEPERLERKLLAVPDPGPGFQGRPGETSGLAVAHPTLAAMVRRGPEPRVWIRQGEGFIPAPADVAARFGAWARLAVDAGLPRWDPPAHLDPDHGRIPSLVLVAPGWVFIKRWVPGSREVQRALESALGASSRMRLGVAWTGTEPAPGVPAPALDPRGLECPPDSAAAAWNVEFTSSAFGPGWELVCQPWPEVAASWDRRVRFQGRLAWTGSVLVALLVLLGLRQQALMRRRQQAEAARLASLLHSLKTPLAIHKLRCDSLRLGRLSPQRAAEELLAMGEEMVDLTRLIERGMEALRGGTARSEREGIGPDWFRDQGEEFQELLAGEGRHLELDLAGDAGMAHEPTLRAALLTLLENACLHGGGTVGLRTWNLPDRLCVEVTDQGPGLDARALGGLGRPGERDGAQAARPGQGLGLSLCFQMVRQEGWGLRMESAPGAGLSVVLEIQRPGPGRRIHGD